MNDAQRDDVHDLTAAYAVDALDADERERARLHLAGCPACASELAVLRRTLDDLAGLTAVVPAPASRAAVLDRIRQVEQLPAREEPGPHAFAPLTVRPGADHPLTVRPGADHPGDELAVRRARRRQRLLAPVATAAALLLVAAAGLGVTSWRLHSSRDAARAQAAVLTQVVSQPDATTVSVARSDPAWAHARVVVSRAAGEAVIVASSAPVAPAGHTWQLWYLHGGVAHSAGLVAGTAAQRLRGGVGSSTGVAVSLEPAGGSSRPTTAPVATFDLPT